MGSDEMVSVTIGLLIDQKLLQTMPFVNDPRYPCEQCIPACERCDIMDCKERVAEPVEILKQQQQ